MISMSRDDLKFVACPGKNCPGDLFWLDDNTIECKSCGHQEIVDKNTE